MNRIFLRTERGPLLAPSAHATGATYEERVPVAALRGHVEALHVGDEWIPPHAPIEELVMADGAVLVFFHLAEAPVEVGSGVSLSVEAVGAVTRAHVIRMAGRVQGVGVRLRAGGMAALLGVPAGELAGTSVPLDALWGPEAGEALDRLAAAPHGPARVAEMERLLLRRLARARDAEPHAGAAHAMALVARCGGRARVRDIAAAVGVGERRLEQLFHRHVGLSPKTALRIARFRAALTLLEREPALSWSVVAHRAGYADQPHLVHECRALAGITPGALRVALPFGFPQGTPAPAR